VTLTRLILNLRRVTVEAEESEVEEIHIDYPQTWPASPGQGSYMSESYELRGKAF
jgi:hypothetical protein